MKFNIEIELNAETIAQLSSELNDYFDCEFTLNSIERRVAEYLTNETQMMALSITDEATSIYLKDTNNILECKV